MVSHEQRVTDHLVSERAADPGLSRVPDVIEIKQQERSATAGFQRGFRPTQAVFAQAIKVNPVLIVDIAEPRSHQGQYPGGARRRPLESMLRQHRNTIIRHFLNTSFTCYSVSSPSETVEDSSDTMSNPDPRAMVIISEAKSCSVLPAPTSCATRLRVTLATGITTPSSDAASSPRSKSFCKRTGVNVGVKSRFTSAGVLYCEKVDPITESFRKSKKA